MSSGKLAQIIPTVKALIAIMPARFCTNITVVHYRSPRVSDLPAKKHAQTSGVRLHAKSALGHFRPSSAGFCLSAPSLKPQERTFRQRV